MIAKNISIDNLDNELAAVGLSFLSFDRQQASIAGSLSQQTKELGLSLGDRACLALAQQLDLPVLTAENLATVGYWRFYSTYSITML